MSHCVILIVVLVACSLAADEKKRACYSCVGDTDGDSEDQLCVNPTTGTNIIAIRNFGCYTTINEYKYSELDFKHSCCRAIVRLHLN